jgi:hypothetical protein
VEPTNILPVAAVISLVTVEYGGWALLTFLSGARACPTGRRASSERAMPTPASCSC